MAKTKTIAECIHHWGNQVEHKGYVQADCGSVRYDGPMLYSYAAEIATLVPEHNVAVISSETWSNTTSKHQCYARRSVPGSYATIYAPFIDSDLDYMHRKNKQRWEEGAANLADEYTKHPRRKSLLGRIVQIKTSYDVYSDAFGLNWPDLDIESVREGMARRAEEQLRQEETRQRQQAERDRQAIAEEQIDLVRWRNGDDVRRYFVTTALRINGSEIETSRGAKVPVEVAPRLWIAANSCRNHSRYWLPPVPFKVGHYRLDKIDAEGALHIGCHHIPFSELERIAVQLGFIQPEECSTEVINRDAEIC